MRSSHVCRVSGILAALVLTQCWAPAAQAQPPLLLRTRDYQSPVRGDPDDLLLIAGLGFHSSDRVVYEAADALTRTPTHPAAIPAIVSAVRGTAAIVQVADPPYALTVRLPQIMRAQTAYRLWVVNAAGEWSDAVSINDPRPLWISPSFVYSSAAVASLERRIRVIGRNLEPGPSTPVQIKLEGPKTYILRTTTPALSAGALERYVAEVSLPARLAAGMYSVSLSRDGKMWEKLPAQRLEVRPDPVSLPTFDVGDPRFGICRPDDGIDDGPCFAKAIQTAHQAGGGVVVVPSGTWDLDPGPLSIEHPGNGLLLPPNVHLRGAIPLASVIVRHERDDKHSQLPLITLTSRNSVTDLVFTDAHRYESIRDVAPIMQLGVRNSGSRLHAEGTDAEVGDVVISNNAFRKVGRAIVDSGRSINGLYITRNEFGAYADALLLIGDRLNVVQTYRIDDAVIRWNHFLPGSYVDLSIGQGTIASQLGAAHRMDFSSNVVDGTSTQALQDPDDPKGWRAAFFWTANGNDELLLVADNRITCSGDKAGDGEAISFDGNANTYAFEGARQVTSAAPGSITVRGPLLDRQHGHPIQTSTFYKGHWVQVVAGPGVGQARKIDAYVESANSKDVTFKVSPAWDVVPVVGMSRILIGHDYWQVYTVANEIDQRTPLCHKSNLSNPRGGGISLWAPSADSVIEGNKQADTDGITFQQAYSVAAPYCPTCAPNSVFQTALEIRGNTIDGEYDWSSDCSNSGITGSFAASPTPDSPPPLLSIGVSISHNYVSHADGIHGGAIDLASTWYRGPPPEDWPLVENALIFKNVIRDVRGPVPHGTCRANQRARTGIRLERGGNVRDTVIYGNRCERVDELLENGALRTAVVCLDHDDVSCECPKP